MSYYSDASLEVQSLREALDAANVREDHWTNEAANLNAEVERLREILIKHAKAIEACRRELLLYAGDPEDHDDGTAEVLALCEAAEKARES